MTLRSFKLIPLKRLVRQHSGAIKAGPFGSDLTSHDMQGGPVRVFNQRNVIEKDLTVGDSSITEEKFSQLRSFEVQAGDVLITTRGTIGKILVVPAGAQRGILHPCLIRVQPDERKLDTRYLAWVLQDDEFMQEQVKLLSKSSTIEVIYSDTMASLRVPCPPLTTQTAIANYLDAKTAAIDALIAKKELLIEELKKYQEAVIAEAVKPREGWTKAKVKGILSPLPKSKRPAGEAVEGGPYLFYVSGQQVKGCETPDYADAEAVVLATGGSPAVHHAFGSFSFSTDCWALVARPEGHTGFLYYLLVNMKEALAELGFRGAGIKHLDKDWLLNSDVAVPAKSEQAAIAASLTQRIAGIRKLVENAETVIADARKLRASLISEAVTGKLRLSD